MIAIGAQWNDQARRRVTVDIMKETLNMHATSYDFYNAGSTRLQENLKEIV